MIKAIGFLLGLSIMLLLHYSEADCARGSVAAAGIAACR